MNNTIRLAKELVIVEAGQVFFKVERNIGYLRKPGFMNNVFFGCRGGNNLITAIQQFSNNMMANKAGSTGNQNLFHNYPITSNWGIGITNLPPHSFIYSN